MSDPFFVFIARGPRTVLLQNIPPHVDLESLTYFMAQYGTVENINMLTNPRKPKGCGFVQFAGIEEAVAVVRRRVFPFQGYSMIARSTTTTRMWFSARYARNTVVLLNLNRFIDEYTLTENIRIYGPVDCATIVRDRGHTTRSRGFAYVQFRSIEDVNRILAQKTLWIKPLQRDQRHPVRVVKPIQDTEDNCYQNQYTLQPDEVERMLQGYRPNSSWAEVTDRCIPLN